MEMRDRLIELFDEMDRNPEITCPVPNEPLACKTCKYSDGSAWFCDTTARRVDYLLANGVIVQKQGEWKVHQNNEYWHYDCPFCDDGYAMKGKDETPPNYCGNCGAELKEREGDG